MTTTISKKNKHTKPASKKRTGKRIGIRNTKRRSKNSKKSKTSKKNKPKNRLYKGGNKDLVNIIKRAVDKYNRKVLLDEDKLNKDKSDQSSIDDVNVSDIEYVERDSINDTFIDLNRIYSESTHIGEYIKLIKEGDTSTASIMRTVDYDVADDIDYFNRLLTNIKRHLPKFDTGVEQSLAPGSHFIGAVNEYQNHIEANKIGYIENKNKCTLERFITCELEEAKAVERTNACNCVTS